MMLSKTRIFLVDGRFLTADFDVSEAYRWVFCYFCSAVTLKVFSASVVTHWSKQAVLLPLDRGGGCRNPS
jgi:hypothetical protein